MENNANNENSPEIRQDFIRSIVADDTKTGKWDGRVVTRFPPEPNGYLHIGHAKSICLNFGIAAETGGTCHLRFDDTNPTAEDVEYVDSIKEDVRWLGWDWGENLFFASDYFQKMYDFAIELVKKGLAYVDDQSPDKIRLNRGTLTSPGTNSPHRDRSVEENLQLLEEMKQGKYDEGQKVLRAKIDMAHSNMNMRDPIIYRIVKATHHRTGDEWCIYPMYDWAHGLEDSIEKITHSICTLEFEQHRPLYDWFLDQLETYHPQQIEFARLNLTYTVMSKRKLLSLVKQGLVNGWDDPRMPTISGLRRRGYSPASIRNFCKKIGVNKFNSTIDLALLEHCLREDLNKTSSRIMAVQKPLKMVITNYPEDQIEQLEAVNNPEDPAAGSRIVPFSRELYIEQDDFMEEPPKKFFRLAPGREVRLRYGYYVTCQDVVKDAEGNITELRCTYDPATKGGDSPDGRKVKATLHWVCAKSCLDAEVRVYDNLFSKENPDEAPEGCDFTANLNPDSLKKLAGVKIEPTAAELPALTRVQFERLGYYCVDLDSTAETLVFNKTVGLKDSWAKIQKKSKKAKKGPGQQKKKPRREFKRPENGSGKPADKKPEKPEN